MRSPGCCLGSCFGLVLGALLALALVVALARWAPEQFERAVRWAVGEARSEPEQARAPERADGDLIHKARRRLRRAISGSGASRTLSRSVDFTEAEIQAVLRDPLGPLGEVPPSLRTELLEGTARMSWEARLVQTPVWLSSLVAVQASVTVKPEVEEGALAYSIESARVAGVPLPGFVARWLGARLPGAPRLPPDAASLLPGLGGIEVHPGWLRLLPAGGASGWSRP
ncbi:MAG: hypothetical protein V3U98_03215 [Acidobacteriota bacterium]